jgi:hypothetical protein
VGLCTKKITILEDKLPFEKTNSLSLSLSLSFPLLNLEFHIRHIYWKQGFLKNIFQKIEKLVEKEINCLEVVQFT